MMPLSMVKPGETNTIKKVGGKEETRKIMKKGNEYVKYYLQESSKWRRGYGRI